MSKLTVSQCLFNPIYQVSCNLILLTVFKVLKVMNYSHMSDQLNT